MRQLITVAFFMLIFIGLQGCGNKGDLELTEEEKKEKVERSSTTY